ncbi:Undecaprenyl phosphate N,N'-diacetylbacillosamine 1-phosphate transferase [Pseudobythopirellula maris]|uniref:Undecaprenyl phosphate N,N'-diacetylbacillosamine 1-phosphate transferase n=1 Tax=Pseudobythopirellula maris TaxID=2527991 RepID=A0A5C5ZT80_9BACT|nr:sugar transferase [Pseudobythopirellula maris]TWT90247.1 Undecaprenyl phosphate N,N'-diacetylbacillosamine 1-phosphate transferase [Pseudobythopirellula maris]
MNLPVWLTRIPAFRLRQGVAGSALVALDRFEIAATAERMRVDRNGSVVSMLAIELPPGANNAQDLGFLAGLLRDRLRLTDTAGMLSDGRVAVLLPDTPEEGAWKVASDICESYPVGEARPNCEVHVYPDKPRSSTPNETGVGAGSGANRVTGPTPAARSGAASYDRVFARRTPWWKRAADLAGASLGLVVAGPVILAAAAAVRITSPGPAIYAQEREGLGGKRFKIYKLRTMQVGADALKDGLREHSVQDGPAFKMNSDPRVTPLGNILRKTSIDELPQLWNVLRGDMSLVGPRPLPVDESQGCEPWQRRRLLVTPGITCTWQVRGRNLVTFDEWVRMDLQYVQERSPLTDLKLIAQTAPAVVFAKGPR